MARREFTNKTKAQAFERAQGRCQNCNIKLTVGNIEYDHQTPDGLGGAATLDNCHVLCRNCHQSKTSKRDKPAIAKADRIKRKWTGQTKARKAIVPGSKASPFKKKLNGQVEWR